MTMVFFCIKRIG